MKKNHLPIAIPSEGEKPEAILQQIGRMKAEDVAWKEGKAWSLVYYVDETHDQLLKAASSELFSGNYLNPLAFKSLHHMEQEVVHMTTNLLHGGEAAVGVMTTGGTESILLSMFCYRQRAKKLHPKITQPEVVVPVTIHPAFDKAAVLFGLQLRKAPVDESRSVIPAEVEKLITKNTILLVASAPSYPNGVLDPIEAIASIATRNHLPFHVDACVGGFMLPWLERLGYSIPAWDYRVAGVTSISADVHKFGFGAKGASVVSYRNMDYLRHQFVVTTDYPGGIYISPTLLGTRAGGPIAAAWAGLKHLGENGYLALAKKLMAGVEKLHRGLETLPGIVVVGRPCMNLISYTTKDNNPDIFVVADQLEDRGWMVERQQFPDCIHLTVLPTNVEVIDQYLHDLQAAYTYASAHPGATAKGNAAVYGLMARIPFRGMVEKSVEKIMTDMYGAHSTDDDAGQDQDMVKSPFWMGALNRILITWARWKQRINKAAMHIWLLGLFVTGLLSQLEAQPYIDPFQVRYMDAFNSPKGEATPFKHLWAGSDLPIKLKENSYLILSPTYERWELDLNNPEEVYPAVQSFSFPVALMLPIQQSKWSLTLIPMVRWNGEKLFGENTFQVGGVTLVTYARKPTQKFRFGVYTSGEFFGLFVVPLLGTDWRIDEKNYLFGTLPGRLTYEHQMSKKWFTGATFRAPTSSYRLPNGQFLRIDDNQISLHLDYYLSKNFCITLEPGYGIMRRLRTGINHTEYLTKVKWGDGPFIKLSTQYRIRF